MRYWDIPEPTPHPTFRKHRKEFLEDFDELDADERALLHLYIRRWAHMEKTRGRLWERSDGTEEPRILGA